MTPFSLTPLTCAHCGQDFSDQQLEDANNHCPHCEHPIAVKIGTGASIDDLMLYAERAGYAITVRIGTEHTLSPVNGIPERFKGKTVALYSIEGKDNNTFFLLNSTDKDFIRHFQAGELENQQSDKKD